MMEVSMSAIPLRTDYDAADMRGLARKASFDLPPLTGSSG